MINEIKRSYFNPTQAFTLVSRCLSALTPEFNESLGLTAAVASCTQTMNQLNESLSRTLKSDFTHKIKEQDDKCDNAFRFLKSISKAYLISHKPNEREAALLLYTALHAHIPSIEDLGYVKEMAILKALGSELEKEKYKAAINTLGLKSYLAYLSDCRNEFEQLYIAKNIAEADKTKGVKTADAAKQAIESLMAIVQIINAHILLSPKAEITEVASAMNSIIESVSKASK